MQSYAFIRGFHSLIRHVQSFGWQTFKRVGASRTINRIYNVVLLLSISIQVALFFIAVTAGLWIDQLINGYIGAHTEHATAFKVVDIVVLAVRVSIRAVEKASDKM